MIHPHNTIAWCTLDLNSFTFYSTAQWFSLQSLGIVGSGHTEKFQSIAPFQGIRDMDPETDTVPGIKKKKKTQLQSHLY